MTRCPPLPAFAPVVCAALMAFGALGCGRKDRNPLLSTPPAGVSGVSMAVRGVDPSQKPDVKLILQVVSNAGTRLTDFNAGNFSILEAEKPVVPLEAGKLASPLFSVALVIDRSGSMGTNLTAAANRGAVDCVNALGPNDRAALIEFESTVKLTVPFTDDKNTLITAINQGTALGSTAFYDGVYLAARELTKSPGIKLMIALGDGDDNSSSHTLDETIAAVQGSGLLIYTIALGSGISNTSAYQRIAEATGGRLYTSATGADLSNIYLGILRSTLFQDLVYVKYRQLSDTRSITVYLNYGDLTASATSREF